MAVIPCCRKGWSGGGHSCGSRLGRRIRRAEAAAVPAAISAGSSAVTASSHCCCSHLHLFFCFCSCKGAHTALAVTVVADACQAVNNNVHANPRDAPCTVVFHDGVALVGVMVRCSSLKCCLYIQYVPTCLTRAKSPTTDKPLRQVCKVDVIPLRYCRQYKRCLLDKQLQ